MIYCVRLRFSREPCLLVRSSVDNWPETFFSTAQSVRYSELVSVNFRPWLTVVPSTGSRRGRRKLCVPWPRPFLEKFQSWRTPLPWRDWYVIALFTVTFSHLHYNVFERRCEAISGSFALFARNCLTFTFKYIVMQMRRGNCEKGYWNIIHSRIQSSTAPKNN